MSYGEEQNRKKDEAARAAMSRVDNLSFDIGDLHFRFQDQTDASWIFMVCRKTGPHSLSARGTANIHFPCQGFHRAKAFIWTRTEDHVPTDAEGLKEFISELLHALGIPPDTTWQASWEHREGGIQTGNARDPNVMY